MSRNVQRKVHNEKIKRVFAGRIASGWETKGNLIKSIKPRDNIVYKYLQEDGFDGMDFLDVGCATGKTIKHIDSLFKDCVLSGIDVSEDMIHEANAKVYSAKNNVKFICDDFEGHDFEEGRYDIIVMKYLIHHVLEPVEVLRKAKQLLKKDGILFVYTPGTNYLKEIFQPNEKQDDILGRKSLESLVEMFAEAGMEGCSHEVCDFTMTMNSFADFVEFLKRIGCYQKIVNYEESIWKEEYISEIEKKFNHTDILSGEYILLRFKNS